MKNLDDIMNEIIERDNERAKGVVELMISLIPSPEHCQYIDLEEGFKRAFIDYTGNVLGILRISGYCEKEIETMLGEWYKPALKYNKEHAVVGNCTIKTRRNNE